MGTQLPSPKKWTEPPIFGPFLLSPNGWMHQDATWYGGRPPPTRLCVRWGPSFPSLKGAQSPQFSVNVRCGQTTGWTKMALGMEVGLGQATLCSMGTQLPQEQRAHHLHPVFGPCLLWQNGWMDKDATWYGSRPRPRPHCIRRGPSSARNGHRAPHLFGPCLLWPRSPMWATAELL